ncbi:hypothetical protein BH24CHL4_BH24CHL4_26620 [soil metagenome]
MKRLRISMLRSAAAQGTWPSGCAARVRGEPMR